MLRPKLHSVRQRLFRANQLVAHHRVYRLRAFAKSEQRIACLVCDYDHRGGGVIDVPRVAEYLRSGIEDGVAGYFVFEHLHAESESHRSNRVAKLIDEQGNEQHGHARLRGLQQRVVAGVRYEQLRVRVL